MIMKGMLWLKDLTSWRIITINLEKSNPIIVYAAIEVEICMSAIYQEEKAFHPRHLLGCYFCRNQGLEVNGQLHNDKYKSRKVELTVCLVWTFWHP